MQLSDVVSQLVVQAPLVAVAVAVLMVYIERRINKLENRLNDVVRSINSLIDFNEAFLSIQISKGLLTDTEYYAMRTLLAVSRPLPRSKYYTKEVYERLGQLLSKGPNEITWDDVFELERIYSLIVKEWEETGREDLLRYSGKLRVFIAIAKGFLLKRGVLPPPNRPV